MGACSLSLFDVPEVAALYGALDSDTVADGRALDAHLTRTVTTNTNRLMGKGAHLATLTWPIRPTSGDYDGLHRWAPNSYFIPIPSRFSWTAITAPIPLNYRRGLRTFEARIRARVYGTVWLQFATRAHPFYTQASVPFHANTLELDDTADALDDFSQAGMLLDPSGYDELTIYARAVSNESDLADDTVGGAPNDRSGLGVTPTYAESWLGFAGAGTWVERGYMYLGTEIAFRDGLGAEITRRQITGATPNTLWWGSPLTDAELTDVIAGDDFSLYRLPTIGLGTISIAAEGRTA